MARTARLEDRIVDCAIDLAEDVGWDRLRLSAVAERLGVPLADVRRHYRDLDAVADAWFGRALDAMLAPPGAGFAALPARERLFTVIMRWFDALGSHRRVSAEMIAAKRHLPHVHHWVPLVFNLSRTVQWIREAAGLDAAGRRRQTEEIGLTLLFLATLRRWARDETTGQTATRDYLARRLDQADAAMARLWRATQTEAEDASG